MTEKNRENKIEWQGDFFTKRKEISENMLKNKGNNRILVIKNRFVQIVCSQGLSCDKKEDLGHRFR